MTQLKGTRLILAVRNLRAATDFYLNVLGFRRDFGDESDCWSWLSRTTFESAWASARMSCQRASSAIIRTLHMSTWTTLTRFAPSSFHVGRQSVLHQKRSRGGCGNSACRHQTVTA